MKRFDLESRVILITGASGGLGHALAVALRKKGARLALLDNNLSAVEALAETLGGPDVARGWFADVREYDTLDRAIQEAAAHFDGIDVVIANAGVSHIAPMSKMSVSAFERTIDINLTGVWRTFRAGLPHIQKRAGHLMAISSMAAFVHSPLQAHYTASKAGVWALCDSIRLELRHLDVSVGSVHPTFFKTPMMDEVHADSAGLKLWDGNSGPLWRMIPIEAVVGAIITGIERRTKMVVVPVRNTLVAKAPGLFRAFIDRFGFSKRGVESAINQSKQDL